MNIPAPNNNGKSIIQSFSRIHQLDNLPESFYSDIQKIALIRHFESGQAIFLEGDPAVSAFILQEGWIKLVRMTTAGREQGLLHLHDLDVFGNIAGFMGEKYVYTVIALEKTSVWEIPSDKLLKILKRYPELALVIISKLGSRIIHYIQLIDDLSLKDVEARLVNALLRNAKHMEDEWVVPRQAWKTFDEMAARLGTVRDVLSRTLKKLEADGLIKVEKKKIILLNTDALSEKIKEKYS